MPQILGGNLLHDVDAPTGLQTGASTVSCAEAGRRAAAAGIGCPGGGHLTLKFPYSEKRRGSSQRLTNDGRPRLDSPAATHPGGPAPLRRR
jgi:hypothetical protein